MFISLVLAWFKKNSFVYSYPLETRRDKQSQCLHLEEGVKGEASSLRILNPYLKRKQGGSLFIFFIVKFSFLPGHILQTLIFLYHGGLLPLIKLLNRKKEREENEGGKEAWQRSSFWFLFFPLFLPPTIPRPNGILIQVSLAVVSVWTFSNISIIRRKVDSKLVSRLVSKIFSVEKSLLFIWNALR